MSTTTSGPAKPIVELEAATVRFCGDSGDGMQLAGTQFTNTSALVGNDVGHVPRLPGRDPRPAARRPASAASRSTSPATRSSRPATGRRPGGHEPGRAGHEPRRPGARRHPDRRQGRLRRARTSSRPATTPTRWRTAAWTATSSSRSRSRKLTRAGGRRTAGWATKEADRCRNFFAMGLVFWLYDRPLEPTLRCIDEKFGRSPPWPRPTAGR